MARPKIKIDFKEFEKLCALQCTLAEVAGWFGCSEDTIERRVLEEYKEGFAEVFAKKRGKGKISLRRWQMQCAEKGNAAMLIFLGKNYLGQKDSWGNEGDDKPININLNYDPKKKPDDGNA